MYFKVSYYIGTVRFRSEQMESIEEIEFEQKKLCSRSSRE